MKETRIAIISDLHLGDPESTLVIKDKNGEIIDNKYYFPRLKKAARQEDENGNNGHKNDYLVLLGDIIDFAIVSYQDAFDVARKFFQLVKEAEIADEIIYMPGNHDFELWHICEFEVNVINRLKKGLLPRPFRWSVPAIIDDRKDSSGNYRGKFELFGVTEKAEENRKKRYGGLYLDSITGTQPSEGLTFNFAHPNLYMMTEEANVLITHGHSFKPYWSLMGKMAPKIFGEDFNNNKPLNLKDFVAINFPLCQLASSGTGQAGPLTERIEFIQRTVKDKDKEGMKRIKKYLDNLDREIDKATPYAPNDIREWITDSIQNNLKKQLFKSLNKPKPDRFNCSWIKEPGIKKLFETYFGYTVKEINEINEHYKKDGKPEEQLEIPDKLIYGHTHCALGWEPGEPLSIELPNGGPLTITLSNTGGWLRAKGRAFKGPAVFTYVSGKGFKSQLIE